MSDKGVDQTVTSSSTSMRLSLRYLRATHSVPNSTARSGSQSFGEPSHGVTFAAGAVADDQSREADARMLGPERLDQLVQGRLAHRVGAQAGPRAA